MNQFELHSGGIFGIKPNLYQELTGRSYRKRYAFGINEYSEALIKIAEINGFIDDFTDKKYWLNLPVLKLSEVEADSIVVSCVTAAKPLTALRRLQEAGIKHYVDYCSLADDIRGGAAYPR